MEDNVSVKSNDSAVLSDDYEFVIGTVTALPQLKIGGGGDLEDLRECLGEALKEMELEKLTTDTTGRLAIGDGDVAANDDETTSSGEQLPSEEEMEEPGDVFQDCTIFGAISYLGAASINAPKSKIEIERNMAVLNEQSSELAIKVSISIPSSSDGCVVLYEAVSNIVMKKFEINQILFYVHGRPNSMEAACFAFTWSHGETQETALIQCHIFRCNIPEAVGQVSSCFTKAFQCVPKSLTASVNGDLGVSIDAELGNCTANAKMFVFEVSMEIKEDDGRGGFSAVPKDRSYFKLRANMEKQVCLNVEQVMSDQADELAVKRCFGVLVSAGRHVKHSDMQLLDMVSMGCGGTGGDSKCYVITGQWDPREPAFNGLNQETSGSFLTVAVDLVMRGISEPVRLLIETPIKIFPQNERFWVASRRPLIQQFYLHLKEVPSQDIQERHYEVVNIEASGELDRNRLNLTLNNLASFIRSPSVTSIDTLTPKDEYASDGDEPMLSGTGEVSKDCSEVELESWADWLRLARWGTTGLRPRQLGVLVRRGIPEALRGEVWQRLCHTDSDQAVMDLYRILITKESNCEGVIMRDINRTFPAHEYFTAGQGQDLLFRISKAYAVYDTEVGYCQGLSFLAATLLLHAQGLHLSVTITFGNNTENITVAKDVLGRCLCY